jgi:hypothetical protein
LANSAKVWNKGTPKPSRRCTPACKAAWTACRSR